MNRLPPLHSLLTCALIFAFATSVQADPPTAKETINAFSSQRGSADAGRIIGMVGFYGQDQPPRWVFLQMDQKVPNLLHEYIMENKKIVGERRFWRNPNQDLPTAPIPFSQVAIDSSRAFVLADQAAKKAGLGFDMIHFQLRGRDLRNEPVWVLNMVDSGQNSIGVLYISAITGETLRSVWHRSPAFTSTSPPPPNSAPAPAAAASPAPGVPETIPMAPQQQAKKGLIPQLKRKRQTKQAGAYAAPPVR